MSKDYTGRVHVPGDAGDRWRSAEDALKAVVADYKNDRRVSEPVRDRLYWSARSLLHGMLSAAVVTGGWAAMDALQDQPTDLKGAVAAFSTGAVAACIAFLHTRRR